MQREEPRSWVVVRRMSTSNIVSNLQKSVVTQAPAKMNLDTQIQVVIDNLKYAVNENYSSIDNPDEGYPYAAGYSVLQCKTAVEQLESIMRWYNSTDKEISTFIS